MAEDLEERLRALEEAREAREQRLLDYLTREDARPKTAQEAKAEANANMARNLPGTGRAVWPPDPGNGGGS